MVVHLIFKMTSQVKLPDIQMQGIYAGKFKDWNPSLAPVSIFDTVYLCLESERNRRNA